MTKSVNRPERVIPADFDVAVDEALNRAKQVTEMSKEELDGVSGGLIGNGGHQTAGMFPTSE